MIAMLTTLWARLKALCLHSATIAWSYLLLVLGSLLQLIDAAGDALGDPSIKDQVAAAIGDARIVGRILLGISIVNIIARVRSLRKAS
jgi:hypothetical protein